MRGESMIFRGPDVRCKGFVWADAYKVLVSVWRVVARSGKIDMWQQNRVFFTRLEKCISLCSFSIFAASVVFNPTLIRCSSACFLRQGPFLT